MHRAKYEGDEGALKELGRLMGRELQEDPRLDECEVIVPIPPRSPRDFSSTATVLADRVSEETGKPVEQALVSAGERVAQKDLSSLDAKAQNIAEGFETIDADAVAGRIALLLDDIFDSGATMQEAARMLRRAGARDVRLLTAVRTVFGWRQDV